MVLLTLLKLFLSIILYFFNSMAMSAPSNSPIEDIIQNEKSHIAADNILLKDTEPWEQDDTERFGDMPQAPILDEIPEPTKPTPPKKSFFKNFGLGIGNLSQFVNKIQTDVRGKKNALSFLPYIQLSMTYPIWKKLSLVPEFTFALPKKSNDGLITKFTYLIIGNISYDIKHWQILTGVGLSFTTLKAPGGTKRLNNGVGFDDFWVAQGSNTSNNIIFHLGSSYHIWKMTKGTLKGNLRCKVGLHIYNLEDKEERALSYAVGLSYNFF